MWVSLDFSCLGSLGSLNLGVFVLVLGTFLALGSSLNFPLPFSLSVLSLLLKRKCGLLAVHSPLSLSSLEFTLLSFWSSDWVSPLCLWVHFPFFSASPCLLLNPLLGFSVQLLHSSAEWLLFGHFLIFCVALVTFSLLIYSSEHSKHIYEY